MGVLESIRDWLGDTFTVTQEITSHYSGYESQWVYGNSRYEMVEAPFDVNITKNVIVPNWDNIVSAVFVLLVVVTVLTTIRALVARR